MSLSKIAWCYVNSEFPDAYCLLWNRYYDNGLATEVPEILLTQDRKAVETDGITELSIH